jgi:nucleotide-binding universal stress UspA family protein
VILAGLLVSCYLTEIMGLHAIFGAFVFGAVMPRAGGEALRHEILERLEQVSVLLLLPVFFVVAGLQVDLSTVGGGALLELVLILLVAIGGKFIGAYAGARLNRVGTRQAGALATLMNTRGLTEIVILSVGLQLAIIDQQIFSMMVVMALVTTIMAGPLLAWIYPRRVIERDVARAERAALGGAALVVVPGSAPMAAAVVDLAAALVKSCRPVTLALARLVPYPAAPLEIGSGLLEMNQAMNALTDLAARAGAGPDVPVVARFTSDPAEDLAELIRAGEPDLVVMAAGEPGGASVPGTVITLMRPPPAPVRAIIARLTDDAPAVLRTAARLASSYGVELIVESGPRLPRGVASTIRELRDHGLVVREEPVDSGSGDTLVVAAETSAGADVVIRGGADELWIPSDREATQVTRG